MIRPGDCGRVLGRATKCTPHGKRIEIRHPDMIIHFHLRLTWTCVEYWAESLEFAMGRCSLPLNLLTMNLLTLRNRTSVGVALGDRTSHRYFLTSCTSAIGHLQFNHRAFPHSAVFRTSSICDSGTSDPASASKISRRLNRKIAKSKSAETG